MSCFRKDRLFYQINDVCGGTLVKTISHFVGKEGLSCLLRLFEEEMDIETVLSYSCSQFCTQLPSSTFVSVYQDAKLGESTSRRDERRSILERKLQNIKAISGKRTTFQKSGRARLQSVMVEAENNDYLCLIESSERHSNMWFPSFKFSQSSYRTIFS